MDTQYGIRHLRTGTRSMDMDLDTKHGQVHAECQSSCHVHAACPRPCCMSMPMLYIHVYRMLHVMSMATPCPCYIFMTMLHAQSMLHVYVLATCPYLCCMSMPMLHVQVNAACSSPCSMERTCSIWTLICRTLTWDLLWTWTRCMGLDMQHGHGHTV